MKTYLKVLYILSWIPMFLIKLVLVLLGLVVVPIALKSDEWPKWAWLWHNAEEGSPDWWKGSDFWWYAVRNPVNNFRFLFKEPLLDDIKVDTDWTTNANMEAQQLIDHQRTSVYRWMYSGPFAGYRKIWIHKNDKYSEVWFGWKVGSSVPGMGMTAQVRLNRKVGT